MVRYPEKRLSVTERIYVESVLPVLAAVQDNLITSIERTRQMDEAWFRFRSDEDRIGYFIDYRPAEKVDADPSACRIND